MSIFRRRKNAEPDLAVIIGRRGVPVTGHMLAMQPTGRAKDGGGTREFDFRVAFTPHGRRPVEVAVRQYIDELSSTGLEAGAAVSVLYDREDPQAVVVVGSPSYRIVGPGVAVKVAGGTGRP